MGRTAPLAQFSAAPWKLPPTLALQELRGFAAKASPSWDAALTSLVKGPRQGGMTPGSETATTRFPTASLHWFAKCGHVPHWDQPQQAAQLILDATA